MRGAAFLACAVLATTVAARDFPVAAGCGGAEVSGDRPLETAATEPLTFRNCRFNGQAMPDGGHFSPCGERKPLVRAPGVSWETAP